MANEGEERSADTNNDNNNCCNSDYYGVLGLRKECSETELRNAYKKLALKWHPDRCSASGNEKKVEQAKKKFQDIQQAYSVLSDSNKRFMYDMGAYDTDDDENGMGDFLNEMAAMMSQTKPNENGQESFEDLKGLFEEMFQGDIGSFTSTSSNFSASSNPCSTSTSYAFFSECSGNNKRHSSQMSYTTTNNMEGSASFDAFCIGTGGTQAKFKQGEGGSRGRRNFRRSKR